MTLDPEQTAALLPCAPLVAALREAVLGLARQQIASPARQVVPMANGGLLLSMLATGPDLCIHKLVSVVPGNRAQGLQIDQKITHQEMANLIGSTRETISLTLAAFKRKELVQLFGRTVVLTDLDGLAALT